MNPIFVQFSILLFSRYYGIIIIQKGSYPVRIAINNKEDFYMVMCPTGDWSCPYCNQGGICMLTNPAEECDDYYAEVGDEEE